VRAPASTSCRRDRAVARAEDQRHVEPEHGRIPLGRSLVVAQIAVSVVLLLAAGLFTRSLLKLKDIDPGFDRIASSSWV
jgi:hypothetical protein